VVEVESSPRLQEPGVAPSSRLYDDDNDPNFYRKLDAVTAGGFAYLKEHHLTKISRENCKVIVDYVLAMQTEIGPS
jgi:hypothetical protein